jgi:ribosomal-protein-alanine N-acetyltransferase
VIADVAIRIAVPADAQHIASMSRDLIEYGLAWGWQPERVARKIASCNTNVVAVGPQGAPHAFGIMEYWDEDAHLVLFAVQAARQRRGIGSAMLLWLEAVARATGSKRIRVEARRDNVAARNFYNEHGYHERTINRAMYGAAVDGIRLEKWLRVESDIPG